MPTRWRPRFTPLLAAALSICACTGAPPPQISQPPATDTRFEFAILQANDVYEISPLDRGRIGGMARVATVLRDLERRSPNTIAVLAGDFVSPSLISGLSRVEGGTATPIAGEQMVALMNAVGFDYVTFGNHEFDIPEESLIERIAESEFTYVAANVRRIGRRRRAPFTQRGEPIPDYVVHTFTTPTAASCASGSSA